MTPPLTSRSHLLVTPDLSGFDWEAPCYCKVTKLGPRVVRIEGLHDAAGHTWSIKRSDATRCTVTASEARSNMSGPLLRQAAMIEHDDAFQHGQIVAALGSQVSIRLLDGTVSTSADDATPVVPIVALLLEALSFGTSEWSVDDVAELHHTILDRICGASSNDGSNDVSAILADLVDPSSFPDVNGSCTWTDPKTGAAANFTLKHAIDYVHYVDGGVRPVQASVGTSFCKPQTRARRQPTNSAPGQSPPSSNDHLAIFDPVEDDDDDAISELSTNQAETSFRKRTARNTAANRPSTKQRVVRQQPETDAEKDAEIARLLTERPGLAERFLQLRSDAAVQSSLEHGASLGEAYSGMQSTMVPVQQRQGECVNDTQSMIQVQQESKN